MNKNELCDLYIDHKDEEIGQAYLSAIICRYWPSLKGYINKCFINVSEEELYDAFIEAILYSLNRAAWRDPNSSVYQDPNGPDKCLNIKIKCMIWNVEGSYQKDKRVVNRNNTNIESVEFFEPSKEDSYDNVYISDLFNRTLANKDYVAAFIVHYVAYGDVFSSDGQLDSKKLCKRLRHIDDIEKDTIVSIYNSNRNMVNTAANYIDSLSAKSLYTRIKFFQERGSKIVN